MSFNSCHAYKKKSLQTTWNNNACHLGFVSELLLHTKPPHWVANSFWIAEAGTLFSWSSSWTWHVPMDHILLDSISGKWLPFCTWSHDSVVFSSLLRILMVHLVDFLRTRETCCWDSVSWMLFHKTQGLSSQLAVSTVSSINKKWHNLKFLHLLQLSATL